MATSRIPIEIDAQLPPAAIQDLSRVLAELGYDARPPSSARAGDGGEPGQGTLWLKAGSFIEPEAANHLLRAVADWIHRRPGPRQRFRFRRARPITVTIFGPNGEQVASTQVQRGS